MRPGAKLGRFAVDQDGERRTVDRFESHFVEQPEAAFDPARHEPSRSPDVSTPRDRLVQRALLELDEGQRDVVVLHWYEGFSFPEVAQVLGISTSAAKVRAHRAYEKLRSTLGKE